MGQHWADTAVSNGYHDHYLSLVDHYLNIEGNGLKLQSVTIQTSMVMGFHGNFNGSITMLKNYDSN